MVGVEPSSGEIRHSSQRHVDGMKARRAGGGGRKFGNAGDRKWAETGCNWRRSSSRDLAPSGQPRHVSTVC